MRDLNYQLKLLCRRNHEGSIATRVGRERQLTAIANQLHDLGFRGMSAQSLRQKHVEALVTVWLRDRMSTGTIKNRMSCMRWWAEKINRRCVVAQSNAHYGIPDRQFVSADSKAKTLDLVRVGSIRDKHVRMSLQLQQAFGLRREEAIKLRPVWAHQGDKLVLKASWTKGGRSRSIPITTAEQRVVLEKARQLVGTRSLIPDQRSYVQQLKIYERHTANAGLSKMHGLRHAYAQQRYRALTGWACPHEGGPCRAQLSKEQRLIDREARLTISAELGHEREQITAVYLGR